MRSSETMTQFLKVRWMAIVAITVVLCGTSAPAFAKPFGPQATSSNANPQSVGQNTRSANPEQQQPKTYTLPPDKEARAIAYAHSRHELYFLDFFFTTLGLILLLQLGVGPRLCDGAERISRRRFLQAVIFAGVFFILLGLLGLPGAAGSHWLARYYGQSVQGWTAWFWDSIKGGVVGLILAIVLTWLFYGLVRRSPRRWWFYALLG